MNLRKIFTGVAGLMFVCTTPALAQTLIPLSPTSNFVCVGSVKNNQIGKFTTTGYRLVSSGAARESILAEKADYQARINPLKDILAEVRKGKKLKKGEANALKSTLKLIGRPGKLPEGLEEKLAVLGSAISTIKNIVALKKSELQTLSDCIHNKSDPNLIAGTSRPQVVVVRTSEGEGLAVLSVLVVDSRIYSNDFFCVKGGSDPAFEARFTTNPCPDVLSSKLCTGILGRFKIGQQTGGGAIFSSPPGEAEIQALVGATLAGEGSKSYQIKVRDQSNVGKTCGEVFGE